jgi:hypothetical protein
MVWRIAACGAIAYDLFEVLCRPHADARASVLLFSGFALLFFASTWIPSLYRHPAYPTVLTLTTNLVLLLDAWLRHSRATSMYCTLLLVLLFFAIPGLWLICFRREQDDRELLDGATTE